jgi:hypothetical protein
VRLPQSRENPRAHIPQLIEPDLTGAVAKTLRSGLAKYIGNAPGHGAR